MYPSTPTDCGQSLYVFLFVFLLKEKNFDLKKYLLFSSYQFKFLFGRGNKKKSTRLTNNG